VARRARGSEGTGSHRRRLRSVSAGNLGDWGPVAGPISEFRVDVGPGYRLYFARRGRVVILLLCGGDKGSQRRDIRRATEILAELEESDDEG
jgi:putative addiction module killer protein